MNAMDQMCIRDSYISASTGENVETLLLRVESELEAGAQEVRLLIPFSRYALSLIHISFLGDGLSDFAAVQPLLLEAGALCHAVRGNNDWGSREERAVCFVVNVVRFYACQ